jgi:hypothetical protein
VRGLGFEPPYPPLMFHFLFPPCGTERCMTTCVRASEWMTHEERDSHLNIVEKDVSRSAI